MNAPSLSKWLLLLVLVLPLSSVTVHADAFAQTFHNVGIFAAAANQKSLASSQPGISIDQATEIVRGKFGGRVLSATPVDRADRRGYEVRMLLDGKRVKKVFIDSRGRVRSK